MKNKITYKFFIIFFFLFVSVFLLTPTSIEAAYSTGKPVTDQLLNIAQAKLDGEYRALIAGKAEDIVDKQVVLTDKAAEKLKKITETQLRKNNGLAEHGQKYTKFSSKLTLDKSEIIGNNATITADENVALTLINDGSKESILTQEAKTHIFKFVRQGDSWSIDEDQEVNEFRPVTPEAGVERVNKDKLLLKSEKSPQAAISLAVKKADCYLQ